MGTRITILGLFFSAIYALLIFRIYDLQVQKGSEYKAQASSIHRLGDFLNPARGGIYFTDKNGNFFSAAINNNYPTIYAKPSEINDSAKIAETLSSALFMDKEQIQKIISKVNDPYEPILKKASEDKVKFVTENKIKGIYVKLEPGRFYPLQELGAHVLGFVSADANNSKGIYGIELYHDADLKGIAGELNGDQITKDSSAGKDVHLTIDRNIQAESERILSKLVADSKSEKGTVIVEDPKTGKILAMASVPNFNPNDYSQSGIGTYLNPAVQAVYEPGSIFKVITMASALDAGAITPDTTYIDTGSLKLDGKTIKNWDLKAHGKLTMTQVIEQSLNTGAAFAEKTLGNDQFYKYLLKFGFKNKTDIDLPGEIVGSLKPLEVHIRSINFATASFGQGISVTPIGLLEAVSAIANHGIMMKPFLNADSQPAPVGRVVSEKASRDTVAMMVSAVEKNQIARIKNYSVAGKTGTAQLPDFKNGGYTKDVINTYVGFVPAYDPKFIVSIKIDKPYGAPLAGATVVPAFRELSESIINYYNIPPDNLSN